MSQLLRTLSKMFLKRNRWHCKNLTNPRSNHKTHRTIFLVTKDNLIQLTTDAKQDQEKSVRPLDFISSSLFVHTSTSFSTCYDAIKYDCVNYSRHAPTLRAAITGIFLVATASFWRHANRSADKKNTRNCISSVDLSV